MPWTYSEEYYREYTRTSWNASAPAYVALMRSLEPFRAALLTCLGPRPGEHILDLATGPGEPALTIAAAVGPTGRVVGVDLAEQMVGIARRVAEARGLGNVEFRTMDCGALELPDRSFDAATCSFGFQIFTAPERAAAEVRRVLRPGGRLCCCVWATGDRVPFLDVLVGPMIARAEPDENGYLPSPYETGGPGELVAFLENAGFRCAPERRVAFRLPFASSQLYFDTLLRATPLGHSLDEEEPAVREAILQEAHERLEAWRADGGYALPAECVLVTGEVPGGGA